MTDRFTKAVEELEKKSPFVCESCGHPHDIETVRKKVTEGAGVDLKDRFSDAVKESGEKSAFACESCGHHLIIPATPKKEESA